MLCSLFNIQVFEVKPSKLRASIDNSAGEVSIIPQGCEDVVHYWFLYVIESIK